MDTKLNTKLNTILLFILSNKDKHTLFNKENPITNETCVTFIDDSSNELSIFFKLENFKKDVAFRINCNGEIIALGETLEPNFNIFNEIQSENIRFGSTCEYDKLKQFLEEYLKNINYTPTNNCLTNNCAPVLVTCKKPDAKITKYLIHFSIAGVIIALGTTLGKYYFKY